MAYALHSTKATEIDDGTGMLTVTMELPSTPPEQDYFDSWIFQSINQSGRHYLNRARKETFYSKIFDAKFTPQNDFILGLISASFSMKEKDFVNEWPPQPIRFGVKVPEDMDRDRFLRIRNDRASLLSFRSYLGERLSALSSLKDRDDIRRASNDIHEDLTHRHLPKLRRELSNLRKGEVLKWISISAGMGVGFATNAGIISGLVALTLAAGGLKTTLTNVAKVKSMPGYFWNRIVGNKATPSQ